MKRIIVILLALIMLLSFASCNKKDKNTGANGDNEMTEAEKQAAKNDAIQLPNKVTGSLVFNDLGKVDFELYPNMARQSCLNFIYLVNTGHFNGIIVDRIEKDVAIYAGDYASGYKLRNTKKDYTIKGEFSENGVENTLGHMRGTLSWVHDIGDNDGAHTEFSIYLNNDTAWSADGKYAAFGRIVGKDSFKVLDKINKRKTSRQMPVKEIMIISATIDPVDEEGFDPLFMFPEPNFIMKEDAAASSK